MDLCRSAVVFSVYALGRTADSLTDAQCDEFQELARTPWQQDSSRAKIVLYPACVVLLGFSSGCLDIAFGREVVRGSGSISEESHRLTGLTGVELSTMGELEIRLGDTEMLQVSADDNLQEYFAITTDGGTLKIGTRPGFNLRPSRPFRYTLTAREIEFIGLSSSGNATAPALRADRLEIRLRSTGDLSVDDLRAGSLAVRISSTGGVRMGEGDVDSLDLTISSTGDYHGESVRSTRATVSLNSTGNARLWVEESLSLDGNSGHPHSESTGYSAPTAAPSESA